jgi:hypothetical protein
MFMNIHDLIRKDVEWCSNCEDSKASLFKGTSKTEYRNVNLQAILRQNIAYFDKLGAGEVTTRITTDANLLQGNS